MSPSFVRLLLGGASLLLSACDEPPAAPTGVAPTRGASANLTATTPTFAQIGPNGFLEHFNIMADPAVPTPPLPWAPAEWSIVRHSRDAQTWQAIEPMMAWHGTMCQKPDDPIPQNQNHPVSSYDDLLFLCRNHMMTAMNATGYGVTYMTPNRQLDFRNGTAVVRFDVSTMRASDRDWIDLWVTPFSDNLITPLDDSLPDAQGEPFRSIHVRMTHGVGRSAFEATLVRGFMTTRLPVATTTSYEEAFAALGLATSATRRDTFELHLSRTRIKFGMPRYNLWWIDTAMPDPGWGMGVVQLGHHSFDPTRGCATCTANTWHWDNIGLEPAVPFTILPGTPRYVDQKTSQTLVRFARPAPAGAYLRFEGIGGLLMMKSDKGPWSPVLPQMQKRSRAAHMKTYFTPIPVGTTNVQFRVALPFPFPGSPAPGAWMVRDVSIWAP